MINIGFVPSGELSGLVVEELGKSFAPNRSGFVAALPYTRSAKIVRRSLRAAAAREDAGDLSSLEHDVFDRIAEAAANGR